MNNSSRMTKVESFEEFVDVVAYVSIGELSVCRWRKEESSIAENGEKVKKRRKKLEITLLYMDESDENLSVSRQTKMGRGKARD